MKTTDGLNHYLEAGDCFQVIGIDEILTKDMYVRTLVSDATEMKAVEWRKTAWHKVSYDLSAWVGKSYLDLIEKGVLKDAGLGPGESVLDYVQHEVIKLYNKR